MDNENEPRHEENILEFCENFWESLCVIGVILFAVVCYAWNALEVHLDRWAEHSNAEAVRKEKFRREFRKS